MQNWKAELAEVITQRKQKGLLRTLEPKAGTIDFSSNDYLSFNHDGTIRRLFESLLPITDFGSTGSRLISGHRKAFEEAEAAFSAWVGVEDSLLFHSGYAGNVGCIVAIMSPHDIVFADRLCHASLLDGVRLSGTTRHYYQHNDLNHLESLLHKHKAKHRRFILTESVFSMDGDQPDLTSLLSLAEKYDCLVLLDEAHAIGVLGNKGRGLAWPNQHRLAVISYPLGKAPGLMGCFVAGPSELKPYLINHARSFIYSTAQPPFMANLLRLIVNELQSKESDMKRQQLYSISELLFRKLNEAGFDTATSPSHILPIILGDEERTLKAATTLKEQGFSVFAIRPPTVAAGASRLRISLHSANTADQIESLVAALRLSC